MNENERAVLAHVVVDPDAWWANVQATHPGRAEAILAGKVARWQGSYDAVKDHPNYQDRASRPDQAPADTYDPAA
ncbi:MAG: hypothetical protein HY521_14965 [Proteobacteria bacterium]|nr:hypothetical protein [Pseudomonadota bacterium]